MSTCAKCEAGIGQRIYIGQNLDEETDLSYLGARYYSGSNGRFISQDPVFQAVGNWKVVQEKTENKLGYYLLNPQTHNSYSYGANNPIRYQDQDGEFIESVVDVAFIVYDIYKVGDAVVTGGDVKAEVAYLAADVAGLALPGATGLGLAGRLAAKGGDEFVQGANLTQRINQTLSASRNSQVLKDAGLKMSYHGAERMAQKNISLNAVENAVKSGQKFNYYHDGANKVGYYDSKSKVFVGTVDGRVTTTINKVSEQYIKNLKSKKRE